MVSGNGRKSSRGKLRIMINASWVSAMEVIKTKRDMSHAYYENRISPGNFSRTEDVIEFHRRRREDYNGWREFKDRCGHRYRANLKRTERN